MPRVTPTLRGHRRGGTDLIKHDHEHFVMAERQLAVFKAQAKIAGSQTFTRYAPPCKCGPTPPQWRQQERRSRNISNGLQCCAQWLMQPAHHSLAPCS